MAKKSWNDFPVDPKKKTDNSCLEFNEVTHVAHTTDAIRVIEDRRIRSTLVYDESCLNTKRTQVSWVSPKTWADGYIYGNIAFVFDWAELVSGKKVYWVEHRQTTGQQICRFLISDNDFTDHALHEYDYTQPHGPLFFDVEAGKWYHNNHVTSEYMILSDLQLSDCKGIRFVDHHPRYCNKWGARCPDLDRISRKAGAEVIGKLIGTGQTHSASLFESRDTVGEIDFSVSAALSFMRQRILKKSNDMRMGTVAEADRVGIMQAIFLAFGWELSEQVSSLLAQYPSEDAVAESFQKCLDNFFGDLEVPSAFS